MNTKKLDQQKLDLQSCHILDLMDSKGTKMFFSSPDGHGLCSDLSGDPETCPRSFCSIDGASKPINW